MTFSLTEILAFFLLLTAIFLLPANGFFRWVNIVAAFLYALFVWNIITFTVGKILLWILMGWFLVNSIYYLMKKTSKNIVAFASIQLTLALIGLLSYAGFIQSIFK